MVAMATEFELAPGRWIGGKHPCFIIAEIGQNHQGDLNIAKKLIQIAKECGADCVKFQKTDLTSRFNMAALSRPYVSPHSWGLTYGEHREHLEFTEKQFSELQDYAYKKGILFTASGMDMASVDFLNCLDVPFFKVGSGDANNFKLLIHTAGLGKPLIVSTGMQEMEIVRKMYHTVHPLNKCLCIMQCTSSYPTPPSDVHLNVIKTYQKEFPNAVVGYSGHEVGIEVSIAAVALGAKVLERHLTIDRSWKGSDHIASLEPDRFAELINGVRTVEAAMGTPEKCLQKSEFPCYKKLAKSIVASRFLSAGTLLTDDMFDIKVAEPKGCAAEKIFEVTDHILKRDIHKDESISEEDIE